MTTTCLNCGQSFEGRYCPNCGQKVTVKRLTASVLLTDILHFFTHIESGFLYSSWNFLVRPGISSRNYLKGERKKYQPPVSFFLIWTGLYIIFHNAVIKYFHLQLTPEVVSRLNIGEQSNILFRNHFSVFIIPIILMSAVLIYYILAKPRYNFVEVIILCLFGAGIYFMICLSSDLILGVLFGVNILSAGVFFWQSVLSLLFNFWFSMDFFKVFHLKYFWPRLIMVSVFIALGGLVIMLYLPMSWLYFKNP
jgi:hypothetical protein